MQSLTTQEINKMILKDGSNLFNVELILQKEHDPNELKLLAKALYNRVNQQAKLLSKINGTGFLEPTHDSSATHREICKEYKDLIAQK